MAKDPHPSMYSLWDVVTIAKQPYRITKVYPQEKCYRVMSLSARNPSIPWGDFYPHHSDITGLAEEQ